MAPTRSPGVIRIQIVQKKQQQFNSEMDFSDELPCGGYEQEDKKIQQNLHELSLESEGVLPNKGCCNNNGKGDCTSECCGKCGCSQKQAEVVQKPKRKVECRKCKQNQAVLIHKNEQICKECLLKNIEYKTRLTLENKIKVTPKSRLLICFSGGLNSICLVKILSNIKKRYQKSQLFAHLECIHIQQQCKLPEKYQQHFEQATQLKLNILPISQIYGDQGKQFNDVANLFKSFKKNSNTIDLLNLFRGKLILDFATQNNFDFVLLAKNGQSLASEIFKYFAKGIGGNAPQLCSSEQSPFQYPLRQHLQKQLQYYFYHEKLGSLSLKAQEDDLSHVAFSEIDSYLDQFIVTLQDKYSHTAPAIVRTGEKIKNNFEQEKKCRWCWLKHGNPQSLCQKCVRLSQYIKDEATWKLLPVWLTS